MSLSSLLLGSSKSTRATIDKGLDDLFKLSATTSAGTLASSKSHVLSEPSSTSSVKKRKKKEDPLIETEADPGAGFAWSAKKPKLGSHAVSHVRSASVVELKPEKKKRTKGDRNHAPEVAKPQDTSKEVKREHRKGKKKAAKPALSENEDEDEASERDQSPFGSEEDNESIPPIHESLAGASRPNPTSPPKKSKKHVPPGETPDQRDSRTIFVGNVPLQVMTTKPLLKKFKRHILSFVPTAKIESVRFRSISFQKPTAKLPSETDHASSSSKSPKRPTTDKEPLRQHDVDRISSWRSSKDTSTDEPGKKYLTPQEKKRVAFIKQDFHEYGDSVNAYIVFAYPPPKESAKLLETFMDPYEAAKIAVKECDGTTFEGKTLRADSVRKCGAGEASGEGLGDPKLSIFVGNLDFASKEEDLRAFFETLVTSERGARPQPQISADGEETRSSSWVTRVRVVKDKDTQLGKGFAYVQFADRECVDEVLALEQDKIKFAKRKLRVQRCKSTTSTTTAKRKAGRGTVVSPASLQKDETVTGRKTANPPSSNSRFARVATPRSMPRGDPNLGKQLENLSKEDRKRKKAANADRVARRLAKKRVKAAMTKDKSKFGGDGRGKERVRARKKGGAPSSGKTKAKKPRVRSDASIAKRNMKK